MLTLRFLGHSAWQILSGGHDILIDPFITGNPSSPVTPDTLNPTHIVVTHGHGDHLGDAAELAARTGALIISSFEITSHLARLGSENVWGMSVGGGRDFDFGNLRFTIAHHGSSFPDGSYAGAPAGVLLTIGERTIYHAGDTALFYDMKLIGERQPIDVALLPIGDNYTMDAYDAARAARLLAPKLVIPMHYNTFPAIRANPEILRTELSGTNVQVLILSPGESHTLS